MTPILSKTAVAQSVLTPVLTNRKNAHGVFLKLYLRNNTGQFEAKRFGANFEQQHGCARCFLQVLSKTALHNFNVFRLLLTKGAHFKQNQSCAQRFDANFTQNHSCTGFFHKIYQKQPIEVPLILLTTKTNIGKLKVARSFLAQPNLSDMRTLF